MPLPHVVARVNKRFTNRFIEPIVRRSSSYFRVHHIGRRSGSRYSTPLYGFTDGDSTLVVLTYGPRADWVQNVRSGDASIEVDGAVAPIRSIDIVGRDAARDALPRLVRAGIRVLNVTHFARLTAMRPELRRS